MHAGKVNIDCSLVFQHLDRLGHCPACCYHIVYKDNVPSGYIDILCLDCNRISTEPGFLQMIVIKAQTRRYFLYKSFCSFIRGDQNRVFQTKACNILPKQFCCIKVFGRAWKIPKHTFFMDIYGKDPVSIYTAGNCTGTDWFSGFEPFVLSGVSHVRNYNIEFFCLSTSINKLEEGNKVGIRWCALDKGHTLVFYLVCNSEVKFSVRET